MMGKRILFCNTAPPFNIRWLIFLDDVQCASLAPMRE